MRRTVGVLACAAVLLWTVNDAGARETESFPALAASVRVEAPLDFCGEKVPLSTREVRERLEKEFLLALWDRAQVLLWLKRSTRYMPVIESMLKACGLPDDLKYVAVAESALRPHAGSHKGAVGFWQFVKHTGRAYGLTITSRIDERRNLFASTRAAVAYLKVLHDMFGSWTLAAAGYNMGEAGLTAEIMEQGTDDYYHLYLPLETQRYVFRILSAKLILSNPERYGFRLEKRDFYPPLSFDRVRVKCAKEIPIRLVAQAANTPFKNIKDLNPELRGYFLGKGEYSLLIPKGAAKGFHTKLARLKEEFSEGEGDRIYVVEKGDNLTSIADRFDVPLPALVIWNRIDPRRPIHPGDRLIIYRKDVPPDEKDPVDADTDEDAVH